MSNEKVSVVKTQAINDAKGEPAIRLAAAAIRENAKSRGLAVSEKEAVRVAKKNLPTIRLTAVGRSVPVLVRTEADPDVELRKEVPSGKAKAEVVDLDESASKDSRDDWTSWRSE